MNGRRVDRDLVGPGAEQGVDVVGAGHAAADRERDEDLLGRPADHVEGGGATLVGGGDVEEGELVGALGVVDMAELDRIAGITQVEEVHALDHPATVDVEAGDDTDGDAHG